MLLYISVFTVPLGTSQAFQYNEESLERIAADALGLTVAIWRSYDNTMGPKYWPPHSIKEVIDELAGYVQAPLYFEKES